MRVVARGRFEMGARKDFEIDPANRENRREMKKRYFFDGTKLAI
jgi:hypothetical protein